MTKYKLTEGEARLLVAVFDHLKPYYEQAKAKLSIVANDMSNDQAPTLLTYYGLLQEALVSSLDARERTIIELRYGLLNSGKCYTHEEIAPKFDVTRALICQIETLALCKIKQYMTELHDEETAAAISLLDAKAQEHLEHAVGAKVQGDAVSGDVYMHNCIACTNARNKLAIQLEIRKFKEQR